MRSDQVPTHALGSNVYRLGSIQKRATEKIRVQESPFLRPEPSLKAASTLVGMTSSAIGTKHKHKSYDAMFLLLRM